MFSFMQQLHLLHQNVPLFSPRNTCSLILTFNAETQVATTTCSPQQLPQVHTLLRGQGTCLCASKGLGASKTRNSRWIQSPPLTEPNRGRAWIFQLSPSRIDANLNCRYGDSRRWPGRLPFTVKAAFHWSLYDTRMLHPADHRKHMFL